MRKQILLVMGIIALALASFAQAPQGFSYQAVVRNSQGEPLAEQSVRIKITIQNEDGTITHYAETHAVTTSPQGVISLNVGSGTPIAGTFANITWLDGSIFLKLDVDPTGGTSFSHMGTTQLLAVPYALYAQSASEVVVPPNASQEEPLFVVKNSAGQIVFAVYQTGVRIYVEDTPSTDPTKQTRGGFAVGGLSDQTKETEVEYMRITPDSARIYLRNPTSKQTRGGFAVGGLSDQTKESSSFLYLTPDNYFIGHNSGYAITTGLFNSALGYESGLALTSGSSNAFLGYQSGFNTSSGSGNLFLGYQSGFSNINGNYNTFLGYQAGQSNVDGKNNTFLGSFAGKNNIGGNYNTFVGDSTGYNNTAGYNNTFLGTKVGYTNTIGYANLFMGNFAGYSNEGGFENIFLGDYSGYSNVASGMNVAIGVRSGFYGVDGWNNVYLGTETGYSNIDGSGNVFIGYQTGMNNTGGTRNIFIGNRAGKDEQGSNKLIIDNTDLDSTGAFIWGDLNARYLRFNAKIGFGANPSYLYDFILNDTAGMANQRIMGIGDSYNYSQLILAADDGVDTLEYIQTHDSDHRYRLFYNDGENVFPRLGIDKLGRVMIGSWNDAAELLHVNGTARFENVGIGTASNYQNLAIYNGVDPAIVSVMGKGNGYDYATLKLEADIGTDTLSYMLIHDNDNRFRVYYYDGTNLFPRLGIDATGKVMIGGAWVDATEMLDVDGNARFRSIGSAEPTFDLSVTIDGTLTTISSDIRLKHDLLPISNSLEKVLKMEGYTYKWSNSKTDTRDVGLIAQEVLKIFPEAVFINPKDGYYGINYSRFPALFVEAFKEQQVMIDDLNKRILELEEKNQEFESLKAEIEAIKAIIGK